MIEIDVDTGEVSRKLQEAAEKLGDMTPLMRQIAKDLEDETRENFHAEGRPEWVPLAASTIRRRKQKQGGDSTLQILQDSGQLAKSLHSEFGADFAWVGSNKVYAAIHQFGGVVRIPARQQTVRLRTEPNGRLTRQRGRPNLAVFAGRDHKRVRETTHQVASYQVKIPTRPWLPFIGTPGDVHLQPEAERTVLETIDRMLNDLMS